MSCSSDDASSTYERVCRFLFEEAAALDARDFDSWLAMLAPDLRYQVATRVTRERAWTGPAAGPLLFDDDFDTLRVRVDRLHTDFAWAEDPPSRTRHLVTNVRVDAAGDADTVPVSCVVLVYRNRASAPTGDLLIGERTDLLRPTGDGFQVARRLVTLDQSTLGSMNLSFFL